MSGTGGAEVRLRLASGLSSFDRFCIPPLLVPIAGDLGLSLGDVALIATAYFVAYGVSQPFWGVLSDRVGRVTVLRGAAIGGAVACAVAASTSDFALLVASRAVAGLCFAALIPTSIVYVADAVRGPRQQHALAVLMASSSAGIACATVLAGLLAEFASWRLAFATSAVLAAALTVVLTSLPEPRREPGRLPLRAQARETLRRPWAGIVLGIGFVEGLVIFGALTFVAAALQQDGVSAAVAGSAAAGFGLANVLCTPLVTRAIRVFSPQTRIRLGAALAAAGLLAAGLATTVVSTLTATVCLGAGFGLMHSTMQLWATQVNPGARALTVSLFSGSIFSGAAVASALAAPLADDGRFSAIFLVAAGCAVVLAVGAAALRRRWGRARERGPEPPAAIGAVPL
ncbi:MFS transporter [Patulibacter sp.]|uniref:MFS transporter n=1 Tax=Patulibacter sp. TaxID=1912859 RepID=UPI00271E5A30|nr:MFS transporter [Patulibacter sp.]MDO9407828.1 MFS transporter [Patulibacter sp.]